MRVETFCWANQRWSQALPRFSSDNVLLLAFGGTADSARGALQELAQTYPAAGLFGCSSAGEIFGTEINDDTLVVAAMEFESSYYRGTHVKIAGPEESAQAGRQLGQALTAPGLKGVLVLSDGLNVNGSELINGLRTELVDAVVITGGLAGDGDRFKTTWVIADGVPQSHIVTAIGMYGDALEFRHGSQGGWDVFGPDRTVTKSRGNVLYELDGEPALQLYKKYLGERAAELPAAALLFPLSIGPDDGSDARVVRTILSLDEENQSMTFAGDVPQEYRAQLMRANLDRLVDGAHNAALALCAAPWSGSQTLAIAISCVGRRLVLGERAEEEIEATLAALPQGTQQVGFYSYGEISPSGVRGSDLHNQTMTLTSISERA